MAIDVYLQIDGIKGESHDSAHQGWIELTSAQLGVTQPKSATASTAGGHTAERCEHRSITVTKLADLSCGAGGNTTGGWTSPPIASRDRFLMSGFQSMDSRG